jgi:hypothetical protein
MKWKINHAENIYKKTDNKKLITRKAAACADSVCPYGRIKLLYYVSHIKLQIGV